MDAAVVQSNDDLVKVVKARIAELGVCYESVSELAGLCPGHLAKILCDPRAGPRTWRRFGLTSLPLVLKALGLKLVVEVDPDNRIVDRLPPRQAPPRPVPRSGGERGLTRPTSGGALWANFSHAMVAHGARSPTYHDRPGAACGAAGGQQAGRREPVEAA
jgi:hypothetical protein